MAASATELKAVFFVLGCVMVATLVYTIAIDGLPFRRDLLTPWLSATLIDFYIHVVVLASWTYYKETNLCIAIIWIVLLICFGSVTTCSYIFIQLLKLSPDECLQDPMYHILMRLENKEDQKKNPSHVVAARIVFSILGCVMIATLIYTSLIYGSPFRKEVYTPWMIATLIDFYINVAALSIWVAYKESCGIRALLWMILIICLGSIATCAYIVIELFQLTSQDPLYLVLLPRENRAESRYETP